MKQPKKAPILKSFGYAFEGIFAGIKKERNMKIHCTMMVLVVAAGLFFQISSVKWCLCFILFGLVMALELVNTAVEAVVDLVTEEKKAVGKAGKRYSGRRCTYCGDDGCGGRMCDIYSRAFGMDAFIKEGAFFMDSLGDSLKKVLLAGIGAVATTAEKSKDVLDDLVKKGELTVEQGKVLNEELKHNIKKTMKEKVNVSVKPSTPEELDDLIDQMTPEQLDQLKERLAAAAEKAKATRGRDSAGTGR